MTEWAAQIVRIEKVEKHPNADALDIVTVLGDYPVVSKRDEYNVGDITCYLPIDTIVPDTEQFYFLCPVLREDYEENGEVKSKIIGPKYPVGSVPEKYRRIKAKKIRGHYSQGMLFPVSKTNTNKLWQIGESIVDVLGLKKYEEEEEDNIPNAKKSRGANAEKAPQGWAIPYYDIESARKYLNCFLPNEEIVLLEKLHGSNAAFCHDGNKLIVKSRNYYKRRDEEDMWWDAAIRYSLEDKLSKYPMLVFFAECIGQVKGFRYNSEVKEGSLCTKLFFFDVWDIKQSKYLDYDDSKNLIINAGLDPVPELYRGSWTDKNNMYAYSEGMTNLGGKHIREGWVMKPIKERYEPKLDGRWQVKLVSETYNLQK